jgi:hypothetical protein
MLWECGGLDARTIRRRGSQWPARRLRVATALLIVNTIMDVLPATRQAREGPGSDGDGKGAGPYRPAVKRPHRTDLLVRPVQDRNNGRR